MKRDYKPIGSRIFRLCMLLVVTITVIITLIYTYKTINKELSVRKEDVNSARVFAEKNIQMCFKNIEEKILSVSFGEMLNDARNISKQEYEAAVYRTLTNVAVESNYIMGMFYIDGQQNKSNYGETIADYNTRLKFINECKNTEVFEKTSRVWKYCPYSKYKTVALCGNVFYLEEYEKRILGTVLVFLDIEKLCEEYIDIFHDSVVIAFNDMDGIISASNKLDLIGENINILDGKNNQIYNGLFLLNDNEMIVKGWNRKSYIDASNVINGSVTTVGSIWLILIVVLLAGAYFSKRIAKNIGEPIEKILSYIEINRKGNVNILEPYKGISEAEFIKKAFSEMTQELKETIEKNYEMQIQLKDITIKAYQSQLNPHFLFNTLQMIKMMSVLGENEKIKIAVGSLAKLLDFNLESRSMVLFGEEIENISNYFVIARLRFGELFNYKIMISEEFYNYECIKFLLQPIIENCFSHGFAGEKKACEISVMAIEYSEDIAVIVKDNGKGIEKQKLCELKHKLKNSDTKHGKHGFGLLNVNQRIKLLYGERYGVDVFSECGKGTQVVVHFPKNAESR